MNIFRISPSRFAAAFCLFTLATTAMAQSTWNYFISDAGGGNSLITWTVTGDLASSPGVTYLLESSRLPISIDAPGIFADSYAANGAEQSIPVADGSYFKIDGGDVFAGIFLYSVNNAPGGGNDDFSFLAPLPFPPKFSLGHTYTYQPGTQSLLLPIDFSSFNPGTYQSQAAGFSSPLNVNLTIGPVPEPSTMALAVAGALGVLFFRRFR